MASIGLRSTLSSAIVECALEVLQSSALSQVGQARLLQGLGLRGFSNYRSMQCIHVPAAKFLPLLRGEGFGAVLLVNARQITVPVASVFMVEARRAAWSIDHQDFRRRVAAVTLGCGLYGASRRIEQAIESFAGLNRRDLRGGRLAGHRMPHPERLRRRETGQGDATGADRYWVDSCRRRTPRTHARKCVAPRTGSASTSSGAS